MVMTHICYPHRSSYREDEKALEKVTQILCEIMTSLEEKKEFKPSKELKNWWKEHKKIDKEREENEKEIKEFEHKKKEILAKLTYEEKDILNLN